MNAPLTSRNSEICRRHAAGESFGSLAKAYGICRERVAQIWYCSKRPKLKFRFNEGRHLLLRWVCDKSKVPNEWVAHYCNGDDVQALEDAGLIRWENETKDGVTILHGDAKLIATDLGRELLKWRPR